MRAPLFLLVSAGCGEELSPRAQFRAEVIPVLESSCAASTCHGVTANAEANGDVLDWDTLLFYIDDAGHITNPRQARLAALRVSNTTEDPAFSSLLRKPLASAYGGLPHYGGENFLSPKREDYLAVYNWLSRESGGGEAVEPLDSYEQRFADEIEPLLVGMSCANGNCHGLSSAVPFHLDPGVGGEISTAGTRANYEAVLSMLALDGDPLQSRVLRKALPLHEGGILHKGGNSTFLDGLDDDRVDTLVAWACDEQKVRVGLSCSTGPELTGFVFVRGVVEPAHAFDLDIYASGTDIYLAPVSDETLEPDELINLTGVLHDGNGDARDPSIDPAGERMLFSLRLSEDVGHEIYEMNLRSGVARALTSDSGPLVGGGLVTNRDPTWGPDGSVWYVSTRAGAVADAGEMLDADLYVLESNSGESTRRSWTPHIERKPTFLVAGHSGGEVDFSVLRDTIPGQAKAHPFRFPPDMKSEYHQHFGITPTQNLFFDLRELSDGRYVSVIGDLDSAWVGGTLGVIDRNFGPEINTEASSQQPGLPFYSQPCVLIDSGAATLSKPGDLYRDPVGLPDGRLLAAMAPDVDLSDPDAEVDLRIVAITLEESLEGTGAVMADRTVLVNESGVSSYDPEPVFVRQAVKGSETLHWDPEGSTGVLHHQGLPMIDALLTNLYPSGMKTPREDIRYARLVESLPLTPSEREPVPPEQTHDDVKGATAVSLGSHGPARVLAEIELAADGTFQAEIPAGVAFRIQALNADRMAVGTMHNRWFDLHPGQTLPQGISGTNPSHYASRCGACHGGLDGNPESVFIEPDVMTTASLTLSRYENQNPRRPITPPLVGDDRVEVDFLRDVQPILSNSCVGGCHDGEEPAGGLNLSDEATDWFNLAYESLLTRGWTSGGERAWVNEPDGCASTSYLVELLTGQEYEAPGVLDNPGVPHPEELGATSLSKAQLLTLIRWIDLGATWVGTQGER